MLRHRILSGSILGAVFLLGVGFMPKVGVLPVLLVISCLAQYEFYSFLRQAGIPAFRVVGIICGGLLITATCMTIGSDPTQIANCYSWEQAVLAGTLLVIFVRQFPQKHNDRPLETIGCTLLGIWYVPYLFNFITRLVFVASEGADALPSATGRLLVLFLVVVVKCADIGAYFTGRFLGRHKLFPRLSPKKTWEGLAGGIALSATVSLAFVWFGKGMLGSLHLHVIDALVLGVLLATVGVVGDLFESLLKRASGIKDSGRSIPGMGGLLDVLDSLLFGAPVLYIYVVAFLQP